MAESRVLILSPFPPRRDGLHGGSQVIARLIDELAEAHPLAVLYLRAPDEPVMEDALAARCDLVEEVARETQNQIRLFSSWLRGRPMWVTDWEVPAFRRRVREVVQRWRPDVVHFESHVMGQYRDAVSDCTTVLLQHEPGTLAARDRWKSNRGWRRTVFRRDLQAWIRYERALLERVGTVITLTALDRQEILAMVPSARVVLIPPQGLTLPREPLNPFGRPPTTLLFIGNFKHPPNVDAATRLARKILPQVRLRHPGTILQLVGDAPPEEVRCLAGESVTVTGRVPSVTPYLDAAATVVIPLQLGGGIRIKVMEALAAGKAVVASPRAVEGLSLRNGHEFMLAETDSEFVLAIHVLLADPTQRAQLAGNARKWASAFQQAGQTARAYRELYSSLGRD